MKFKLMQGAGLLELMLVIVLATLVTFMAFRFFDFFKIEKLKSRVKADLIHLQMITKKVIAIHPEYGRREWSLTLAEVLVLVPEFNSLLLTHPLGFEYELEFNPAFPIRLTVKAKSNAVEKNSALYHRIFEALEQGSDYRWTFPLDQIIGKVDTNLEPMLNNLTAFKRANDVLPDLDQEVFDAA